MKRFFHIALFFSMMFVLGLSAFSADKIGIAKPIAKQGVTTQEVETLWSMLEASVDGGFTVVSRSALETMLTEVKLTENSGLVDLNSEQKAQLGKIKGVKYLLVTTIGKFGSRLNVSMMLLDPSTGEIDPNRRSSETVASLDEFADVLKDMLNEMGLGKAAKKRGRSALLSVFVTFSPAPAFLSNNFNPLLESYLLAGGVKLQNLKSIDEILKQNNISSLSTAKPAMYVRIGELLRVDYLILPTVTRYTCLTYKRFVQSTGREVEQNIGSIEGSVRIIDAHTGEVAANLPFMNRIDFSEIEYGDNWVTEDYGKYLVAATIPPLAQAIVEKMKGLK